MKFLADENLPRPSINLLLDNGLDIVSIASLNAGASDLEVIRIAIEADRIILTHDSDYGELIFKHGMKPKSGVVYFRLYGFEPDEPGKIF